MRQSHLYFIAAALFIIAACLNVYNEGVNFKTGLGIGVGAGMLFLGLRMRKTEK